MHVGGAHYNDESNIFKIINSINYGMNGACGGGVWGLGQLQDYSRWPRGQCAFVSSKSSSSTSLSCSTTSSSSFSTSTTNINCNQINNDYGTIHLPKYNSQVCWSTCTMPMGTKSPHESLNTDEAMDGNIVSQKWMEANLDFVVQMALFDPFEIRMQQGAHAERPRV